MSRKTRLAVVMSHPIPYWVPLYRALTTHSELDLRVFYASKIGLNSSLDPAGMGVNIVWKTELLAGYEHEFLPAADKVLRTTFREMDNSAIGIALASFKPDVVLVHGYVWMVMVRALVWCRMNGVPVIMSSDSSLHSGTSKFMRKLKCAILPIIFRQFSAFISIGDANQKYLETFGAKRASIFRISNVVDERFWRYRERREAERGRIRTCLGLHDDDLAVLYVGKLIARKRPADLIAALAHVRKMPPAARSIKVLLVGDGAQRNMLEEMVTATGVPARFQGFVNIDTLPEYYCAADVLVHPAEIETFGMITIEGAILGLPLVLSDHVGAVGPTSIARIGENTIIYPCGDTMALADILHKLANDMHILTRLQAASLRISRELDWRMSVDGMLAAVDYCLRARRPRLSG